MPKSLHETKEGENVKTSHKSTGRCYIFFLSCLLIMVKQAVVFGYNIGDHIETTATVNVRPSPAGTPSLGTQGQGIIGTIVSGPSQATFGGTLYTWWDVNFPSSPNGWVADANFESAPPIVSTSAASLVAATSATLNSTVYPNSSGTTVYFQYGLTASYGSQTSSGSIGTTAGNYGFSISGLSPNTIYHFRIVAYNGTGLSQGSDMTFSTLTLPLPNLTPYLPPNWSDKIVVARTTSTTTDSAGLTTADTLYVNYAVQNNGNAATGGGFYNTLYVDGVVNNVYYYPSSLSAGFYFGDTDYSIGSLNAGTHTIMITADSGLSIAESNEGDNSYTKTISVSTALPDLITQNLQVSPTRGNGGATVNVSFTIKNQGTATAGTSMCNVRIATSSTTVTTGDPLLFSVGVQSLTAGQTLAINQNVTIPPNQTVGQNYVWVIEDVNNTAGQGAANEANDKSNTPLTVTISGTSAPIITTQPQNQTVQTGASITFTVVAASTSSLNYQWRLNGQIISGATSSTLTLNSVTAANSGGYSVVVSNPYGSITSATASLAVLADGANGNQPAQIATSPVSSKPNSISNLVFVTHGWQPKEFNPSGPPSQPWMVEMTNAIAQQLAASGQSNTWQVEAYYWLQDAWTEDPNTAINNAKNIGALVGKQMAAQGWQHVHLIAHSAGAALIQAITDQLKMSPNPPIVQETFLDPFTGRFLEGRGEYGLNANWADDYFVIDSGTDLAGVLLANFPGSTSGQLEWAYNVDVGATLDAAIPTQYIIGNGTAGSTPPVYISPSHGSPIDFYASTIDGAAPNCAASYGFPFSAEAGGASNWTSHSINNPPYPLCGMVSFSQNQQPIRSDAPFVFSLVPNGTSSSGVSFLGSGGASLSSSSTSQANVKSYKVQSLDNPVSTPAWFAVGVTVTDAVNFVQFDAGFTDANAAQGLLTVYWNTNQVGMVDERVASTSLQTYRFALPSTVTNGLYTLSFRLDSFTNSSSIAITNVATGFVGVRQSMMLGISLTNGMPLVQLTAATNFTYLVQSSTNLVDWTDRQSCF